VGWARLVDSLTGGVFWVSHLHFGFKLEKGRRGLVSWVKERRLLSLDSGFMMVQI